MGVVAREAPLPGQPDGEERREAEGESLPKRSRPGDQPGLTEHQYREQGRHRVMPRAAGHGERHGVAVAKAHLRGGAQPVRQVAQRLPGGEPEPTETPSRDGGQRKIVREDLQL